jgi:hypothetical protein
VNGVLPTLQGSAYIFKRDGASWTEQQKLIASDGAAGDYFGCSVAIDGDYAIVGAVSDNDHGDYTGSAYIFKRDSAGTWTEQAKLTAQNGAAGDSFGTSVAIDGDYTLVGAYADDSFTGSAYIFEKPGSEWTTMTETAKLTASDGAGTDWFGTSVAIDGEYAIVGAYGDDVDGKYGQGSAYIFKRGTLWTEQQKLTASDGAASDWFGRSVAIAGEYAIVGAYGDDVGTNPTNFDQGSAYLFFWNGTGWEQKAELNAQDGASDDYVGNSVAIDGDYEAIVGAHGDDVGTNPNQGSAYVYDISGEDPGSESIPEFSTIAIPIAALLGLVFLFSRRRGREE